MKSLEIARMIVKNDDLALLIATWINNQESKLEGFRTVKYDIENDSLFSHFKGVTIAGLTEIFKGIDWYCIDRPEDVKRFAAFYYDHNTDTRRTKIVKVHENTCRVYQIGETNHLTFDLQKGVELFPQIEEFILENEPNCINMVQLEEIENTEFIQVKNYKVYHAICNYSILPVEQVAKLRYESPVMQKDEAESLKALLDFDHDIKCQIHDTLEEYSYLVAIDLTQIQLVTCKDVVESFLHKEQPPEKESASITIVMDELQNGSYSFELLIQSDGRSCTLPLAGNNLAEVNKAVNDYHEGMEKLTGNSIAWNDTLNKKKENYG